MLIIVTDSRDENFVRCVVKDMTPESFGKLLQKKPEDQEVEEFLTDQVPNKMVEFEYVDLADY